MASGTEDEGTAPINFRAALAAFENNAAGASSSSSTRLHTPKPRAWQAPNRQTQTPQTTAPTHAAYQQDPVPRSSSTPRIRKISDGLLLPSSNNPFSSGSPAPVPTSIPATSASGMLSALSPTIPASASPTHSPYPLVSPLKKSGSGLSLHELTHKSLPGSGGGARSSSQLLRPRSKSIAPHDDKESISAPASGRTSPFAPPVRAGGLFAPGGDLLRTSSPASTSQHMLDTSGDSDTHPMFAHAVMQHSSAPGSPDRKATNASFPRPPPMSSRSGSTSSAPSASTPRLPPRPGSSLAPSPTVSEFGQLPAATPKSKTAGVGYATYTPGAKRGGGDGSANGGADGTMTPPALPPRSATLGQADKSKATDTPYKARHRSPLEHAPTVPKKPASTTSTGSSGGGGGAVNKPVPPPRPGKPWEGGAGGFRFGTSSSPSLTPDEPAASVSSQPPPPPRQRATGAATPTHNRSLTGGSITNTSLGTITSSNAHRKSGSNVFTSISLSDDASNELKRSLESDLHSDHAHQLPPPSRGRLTGATSAAYPPSVSRPSVASSSAGAGAGVVSSLIGSAASALPLFKSASGSSSRSLADGAPSKQQAHAYYPGGVAVSRSASAHSDLRLRPGEGDAGLWGGARAVELADGCTVRKSSVRGMLKEPRDAAARERYERLFERLVVEQNEKRSSKERGADDSNASTVKGMVGGKEGDGANASAGVQALKGWFESDPSTVATSSTGAPTPAREVCQSLSAKRVAKLWSRSRLPASFLAHVWDAAVQLPSSSPPAGEPHALGKEPFVRGLASIDAELERRKLRRQANLGRNKATSTQRRVPPPPRARASVR